MLLSQSELFLNYSFNIRFMQVLGLLLDTVKYIYNIKLIEEIIENFGAFLIIWAIFQLFLQLIFYLGECFIEMLLYAPPPIW